MIDSVKSRLSKLLGDYEGGGKDDGSSTKGSTDRQDNTIEERLKEIETEEKPTEPIPTEIKIVLSLMCVSNMCYYQVDPYFPQFLIDHGEMNQMYLGLNMSIFAGAKIISSLFSGWLLQRIDRIHGCFIGASFDFVYLFGFGCLDFFGKEPDSQNLIIGASFALSVLGGIGNGFNGAASLAVESGYKERRQEFVGYNQLMQGLGALGGPVIGSFLYYFGGYKCPLFTLGTIYMFMCICLFPLTRKPKTGDGYSELTEDGQNLAPPSLEITGESSSAQEEGKVKLGVKDILFTKKAFFANGANTIGNMALAYTLPTYSTHMVADEPKLNAAVFGIILAASAFWYAAQMPFSTKLMIKLSRRWVVYIGLIIQCVAHVLMGLDPGSQIGKGAKIGFNILGMSIFGFGLGFVLIPLLPEILDAAADNAKAKGIDYSEKSLEDYASGYFMVSNAIGWTIGPTLSSQLMNAITYCEVQMVICGMSVAYLAIYMLTCGFYDKPVEKKDNEIQMIPIEQNANGVVAGANAIN